MLKQRFERICPFSYSTLSNYDQLEGESIPLFLSAFKTDVTKQNYCAKLNHFLRFAGLTPDELLELARDNPGKFEALFLRFIEKRKSERVTGSTILMAGNAVKVLFVMNDIKDEHINWKKINRTVPTIRKSGSDRPPTVNEIRKLILYLGLRLKVIILLLESSGMRIGALHWLHWQDVEPVEAGDT
jgi:integrase